MFHLLFSSVEAGKGNQPRPASVLIRGDGVETPPHEELLGNGVETPLHEELLGDGVETPLHEDSVIW